MNKRQRLRAELSKLKAALRGGDSTAANNLAATYRQLGYYCLTVQVYF